MILVKDVTRIIHDPGHFFDIHQSHENVLVSLILVDVPIIHIHPVKGVSDVINTVLGHWNAHPTLGVHVDQSNGAGESISN